MKNKRHLIQVRDASGKRLRTIQRVVRAEQIGNFNPIFCTYKNNKRLLVQSDTGDVSDPFRRTKEHLEHLFVQI